MSNFSKAKIKKSNFINCNLKYSIFDYSILIENGVYRCDLSCSSMHDVTLNSSIFIGCNKDFIKKDDQSLLKAEKWESTM